MTTEITRDLAEDLAICEAAISGPWHLMPSVHSEYQYEVCRSDFLDTIVASAITEDDARFIAEAREGWPHAIRRAVEAESALSAEEDRRCRFEAMADEWAYENEMIRSHVEKLRLVYERGESDEALAVAVGEFLREVGE
ncbi:hypothetical protein DFP94_101479 [Fontibacillus phaseoli]|uniref:Uncharacterized protein n=1 Tax=Fontibacillus phaseoli TaxID=1416533 RepID=A0A369BMS2_9BACL|nr:hypothetical protein [Fontibacillus phaseoli]RCX22890.1 hypothetical protein DFP94_101479 [Fontibacillus phaseoli]